MYEINKLLHGQGGVRNFHTRCLYQKSHSLAALARLISDTSPTRAKIPHAPPAHEVISIFLMHAREIKELLLLCISPFLFQKNLENKAKYNIYGNVLQLFSTEGSRFEEKLTRQFQFF